MYPRIPGWTEHIRPPEEAIWVWLTLELLESPAWTTLPINARRVLDFLLIEFLKRGGLENGRLKATHRSLNEYGVGTQYIKGSIDDLERRGLIAVQRGVTISGLPSRSSRFRITWLPTRKIEKDIISIIPPTNDWRTFRRWE